MPTTTAPSGGQPQRPPNKQELQALAFQLISEKESIDSRLVSVRNMISQIDTAEFMQSIRTPQPPTGNSSVTTLGQTEQGPGSQNSVDNGN